MRAGRLNKRIAFYRPAITADAYGDQQRTLTLLRQCWAAIEPLNGREFFQAQGENSSVSVRLRCRYFPGLDTTCVAQHDGLEYDIQSVIDPKEQHAELVIMCARGEKIG